MLVLELVKEYSGIAVLVGQALMFVFMMYLKGQFAPRSVVLKLESIERRMDQIEVRVERIPSVEDLYALDKLIMQLSGQLDVLDERFSSFAGVIKRLQLQQDRVDEFWKQRSS